MLCALGSVAVSRSFFTSPCEASPFPPSYRGLSGIAELALSGIWSWSRWLGAECKEQFTMQFTSVFFMAIRRASASPFVQSVMSLPQAV